MTNATRLWFAGAVLIAGTAATSAPASDVSGTVYGTIGTGGVTAVGGSVTIGTGDTSPSDDPAPPMTPPATPGTTGSSGVAPRIPPVIPDATSDGVPLPTGSDPDHH